MQVNEIVIGVGSNIDPEENIKKAKAELTRIANVVKESEFVYTKPLFFYDQPDFLNGVYLIQTYLDMTELKNALLRIETRLGRERTENKNGPRTIDLDILIYNKKKVNKDSLQRDFIQKSVSEVLPDLKL
jgi:2-amino-4-hydroxy-6-hydroxymethyldihydropteridine diphosphokinase